MILVSEGYCGRRRESMEIVICFSLPYTYQHNKAGILSKSTNISRPMDCRVHLTYTYVYDLYLIVSKFKVIHKNDTLACLDSLPKCELICIYTVSPFTTNRDGHAFSLSLYYNLMSAVDLRKRSVFYQLEVSRAWSATEEILNSFSWNF